MTTVARIEVEADLRQDKLIAGLAAINSEVDRSMAKINREKAVAKIKGDLDPLKKDLKEADAELKKWQATHKKAMAGEDNLNARSTAQYLRLAKQRQAALAQEVRSQQALLDSKKLLNREEAVQARVQSINDSAMRKRNSLLEANAKAQDRSTEALRRSGMEAARTQTQIARLQKEFAKLDTEGDRLAKQHPFFRETKVKLEIDKNFVRSRMLEIKEELEFLGGHPPVHIKTDIDRSFLQRQLLGIRDTIGKTFDKLGNVGNVRLNLGPFSGTIRTFGIVLATLGPIVTSLLGSATALVGVLGQGLAGAAAVAGGALAGLLTNFLGVAFAVKPAITDFKEAMTATKAYQTAIDKHGKGSKQAIEAQKQMNSVLKSVDPNAAKAAAGLAKVDAEWQRLTGATARKDVGQVLVGAFQALDNMMPILARNTNDTMNILTSGITKFEHKVSTGRGLQIIQSLGQSANQFLKPTLGGFTHLASAFGNISESAARLFAGKTGRGFDRWAKDLDSATAPGAHLDHIIKQLGDDASRSLHLFSALGKLLVTVLHGGAAAGRDLLDRMTDTLNKWNEFLKTPKGQAAMAKFFHDAADNTRELWHALSPLIAAFVTWSTAITPVVTGVLKGVSAVSKLVDKFTTLIGFKGALSTLAVTFGALWAVGRLGAFVSLLGRAVGLIRSMTALETVSTLATGGFGKKLAARGAVTEAESIGATAVTTGAFSKIFSKGSNTAAKSAAKAAGTDVGEELATGLSTGAAAALGTTAAVLLGGGLAAYMLVKHGHVGQNIEVDKKGLTDLGKQQAGPAAKGWTDAYQKYITDNVGKVFSGDMTKAQLQAGALAFAKKSAAAMQTQFNNAAIFAGVGTSLQQSLDSAFNNISTAKMFAKFGNTKQGGKFLENIQLTGDTQAQKAVSQLAQSKVGVKTLTILSKGGPEAIKQLLVLAHTQIGVKVLSVIQHGGKEAAAILDLINSKKLRDKLFKIIQNGGEPANALMSLLNNHKISNKEFKVLLRDIATGKIRSIQELKIADKKFTISAAAQQAIDVANHIRALLASITNKNVTIRATEIQNVAKQAHGASGLVYSPHDKRMINAANGGPAARGAIVNRPTLLTGEENQNEIVLATNPAYRKQNIDYWMQAGGMLGIPGFAKGGITSVGYAKHQANLLTGPGSPYEKLKLQISRSESAASNLSDRYDAILNNPTYLNDDGSVNTAQQRRAISLYKEERSGEVSIQGMYRKLKTEAQRMAEGIRKLIAQIRTGLEGMPMELVSYTGKGKNRKKVTKRNTKRDQLKTYLAELTGTLPELDDDAFEAGQSYFAQGTKILNLDNTIAAVGGQQADTSGSGAAGGDSGATDTFNQGAYNQGFNVGLGRAITDSVASMSGSDIGAGFGSGAAAGGSGSDALGDRAAPNIYIQTLHPGDPQTLRAVADAAAAGFSYQGSITSSKVNTGL